MAKKKRRRSGNLKIENIMDIKSIVELRFKGWSLIGTGNLAELQELINQLRNLS